MTISTTSSRVDYTGDGSSTAFSVPFPFFDTTELRVLERVIATGAETTLALSTNYTVSGGDGATGTVTALAAPAATKQWTILRATRRTQEVDYLPNDSFPAETHERAIDRLTALVQENERDAARSLRIAETDPGGSLTLPTSVARASRILGFDASGNPVPVVPEASSLVVTPLAQTLLDDTTIAQMLATLRATYIGEYREVAFATLEDGWLWANGTAVSRTTYASLFAKIGTTYGVGDGSTTFNLPDRCGRAAFGKDDMGGIAAKSRLTSGISGVAGATLGASGGDQRAQQHVHTITDPGHAHTIADHVVAGASGAAVGVSAGGTATGSSTTNITINASGAGGSQNIPPALVVNVMIYSGVYA